MEIDFIFEAEELSFNVNELIVNQNRYKTISSYNPPPSGIGVYINEITMDIRIDQSTNDFNIPTKVKEKYSKGSVINITFLSGFIYATSDKTSKIELIFYAVSNNNSTSLFINNGMIRYNLNGSFADDTEMLYETIISLFEPTIINLKKMDTHTGIEYLVIRFPEIMKNETAFCDKLDFNFKNFFNQ